MMKVFDCNQRTAQWFECRLGIPTASRFGDIITITGTRRTGAKPVDYMRELLGERLTRMPSKKFCTEAMQRGTELEPLARDWYSKKTGQHVHEIGFVLSDNGRYGGSPDGHTIKNGLEIKCPGLPVFLSIAETLTVPDSHMIQMQGCMWIWGISNYDYCVWTDVRGIEPLIIHVQRNDELIAAMEIHINDFCDELDAKYGAMRGHGYGVSADTPILLPEGTDEEYDAKQIADLDELSAGSL